MLFLSVDDDDDDSLDDEDDEMSQQSDNDEDQEEDEEIDETNIPKASGPFHCTVCPSKKLISQQDVENHLKSKVKIV